jgi:hypothetical protein
MYKCHRICYLLAWVVFIFAVGGRRYGPVRYQGGHRLVRGSDNSAPECFIVRCKANVHWFNAVFDVGRYS